MWKLTKINGEIDNIHHCKVRIIVFKTHFQQYFSYIVAISFIGGENHRPVASHWQNLSDNVVTSNERELNSQL